MERIQGGAEAACKPHPRFFSTAERRKPEVYVHFLFRLC